ncbi:MAG: DUF4082 domain-containing protein, partial [Patescibacteria group bacterium]
MRIHRRENDIARIGFTLIELIIYIGIAGGVLLTFTLFILNIVATRNKTLAVNEVQTSGRIALAAISARIRNATGINDSPASILGTDPGILSLKMDDLPAQNPTIIRLSANNGFLQIQEGTNAPIQITSPLVRVTHLSFTNAPLTGTKKNILIQLIIEYGDPLESQIVTNSLWSPFAVPGTAAFTSNPNPIELGIRFTSDVAGYIRGIRFYKGPTNISTHTGRLWTDTGGTPLGTATFTGETALGWQEASFSSPILISANTPYIASYHVPNGNYAADTNYFATQGIDRPPLHAAANISPNFNGRYAEGPAGTFPNTTLQSLNYWVDVVFSTQGGFLPVGDVSFVHSQSWQTAVSLRQQTDVSFWSPFAIPGITAFTSNPNPIELGIRFTSD